jgi:hypothetical protein
MLRLILLTSPRNLGVVGVVGAAGADADVDACDFDD